MFKYFHWCSLSLAERREGFPPQHGSHKVQTFVSKLKDCRAGEIIQDSGDEECVVEWINFIKKDALVFNTVSHSFQRKRLWDIKAYKNFHAPEIMGSVVL
ncbi:MAG: hypothetical protein GY816_22065 [Cytophagales bacterium]|nr:hypothetical protein [Cytophagales bacterium]